MRTSLYRSWLDTSLENRKIQAMREGPEENRRTPARTGGRSTCCSGIRVFCWWRWRAVFAVRRPLRLGPRGFSFLVLALCDAWLLDSLRRSSVRIGTIQRRLTLPCGRMTRTMSPKGIPKSLVLPQGQAKGREGWCLVVPAFGCFGAGPRFVGLFGATAWWRPFLRPALVRCLAFWILFGDDPLKLERHRED